MEWPARAEAVKDGAQRHPQGFVIDGFEHDGTLERGAAGWYTKLRVTSLYAAGQRPKP